MRIPFGEHLISWRDISYRVIGQLGSPGGTSTVFLTLATSGVYKGITCAVKVFHKLDREEWRMNFMREVNFLRSCNHPAIMAVLDEGLHDGKNPFIVMEYFPATLHQVGNELDNLHKLNFITQLLSAINYIAHLDPPIVHRDIKPKNIFLKADSCILGDFGLLLRHGDVSRLKAPGDNQPGVPAMAINYRTPELVAYHRGGAEPTSKSDVFQLGLVAAELFTGVNPLKLGGPIAKFDLQIIDVEGELGFVITSLIRKMLTLDVSERPSATDALSQWQEQYWTALRRRHEKRKIVP